MWGIGMEKIEENNYRENIMTEKAHKNPCLFQKSGLYLCIPQEIAQNAI